MTSGDEVSRPPPLIHGTGGSAGRDAPVDMPITNLPAGPEVADTPTIDQTTTGEQTTTDYDAGLDTGSAAGVCEIDALCGRSE